MPHRTQPVIRLITGVAWGESPPVKTSARERRRASVDVTGQRLRN